MRKSSFISIKITIKRAFNFLSLIVFLKLFDKVKQDNALKTICYALNL